MTLRSQKKPHSIGAVFFTGLALWCMVLRRFSMGRFSLCRFSMGLYASAAFCASSQGGFDKGTLDARFANRSADHGVIFSRLSDGKILYESNADLLLSPASVTKIITSAAALANFGPSFSFKTPIFYTGVLNNGRISGDLVIGGNGDPFLVSEILWQTAVDLRQMGVRSIGGDIILDGSLFDDEARDESRKEGAKHSTHAYDAPVSAFAVNFNTIQATVSATSNGKSAVLSVAPFPLEHVKLTGRVTTTRGASSDGVSASRTSLGDGGVAVAVNGSIGEQSPLKKIYRSVASPTVAAGDYVRGFLLDAGIKVKGKARVGRVPAGARLLYEIQGYEMRRIAAGLNTFSNNFIADMLTKRMGAAFPHSGAADQMGSGTLARGVQVLTRFLTEDVGIKTKFSLLNGSGLSTENRLSARQIMQVLT
ncbi:MAG: D-alanyl-D-alanine carboxypeptidase/D-alanyl-D-alanine-endopeptidase, partial [Proteobacteria bacterium]|nr:D-alanyl-D-alanine carboxypeptidase/D-alanyl-D-alanine-endopeptidase [Pseudomonadota bacterium]